MLNLRLLVLVFAPFAFGTSAFAFVGLIDPMAADLRVSVPLVGQLQTVFALACGIGGPLLARALGRFDRKLLLTLVMLGLAGLNIATALAPSFSAIAAIRIIGGLFAALTLPLATTIAVNLVEEVKRPAAIATVLAGYTLAFLVGLPLCTWLGAEFGWQAAFWFGAGVSALSFLMISIGAPSNVSAPAMAQAQFRDALQVDNLRFIAISLLIFAATFSSVSLVGPVITAYSGVTGAGIGAIQFATGFGSLLGLPAGAFLARLPVRQSLGALLAITLLTQAIYFFGMTNDFGVLAIPSLIIVMSAGSASLFASSPIIQTELAKAAGPAATIAFALNGSMIYFGQGIGASLGGAVTAGSSLAYTGLAGALVAMIGLGVVTGLGSRVRAPVSQPAE
ncbi:MAG: MFS transporter [Pseudomonadota bacterium]